MRTSRKATTPTRDATTATGKESGVDRVEVEVLSEGVVLGVEMEVLSEGVV